MRQVKAVYTVGRFFPGRWDAQRFRSRRIKSEDLRSGHVRLRFDSGPALVSSRLGG